MAYTPPNLDKDEKEILRTSISELRRVYDHIANGFDQLRAKALALLAGEVAVVSFIFGAGNKIQITRTADIRIFFSAGIACLVVGFGILLWILSSVVWKVPHDIQNATTILKNAHSDEDEYLEHLHDDLVKDNLHNMNVAGPKLRKFNWSIYLLAVGAIILLVIKYGGTHK